MGRRSTRHPSAPSAIPRLPDPRGRLSLRDLRLWTAALLLANVAFSTALGATATEPKRVLLLHSFGRDFAPYDAIVAAFRTELAKGSRDRLAVYDATLDAEQVSESEDPQPLLGLLRHRFGSAPPDVVVTIGPPAAAFYLQNREKLFPGTPLVISALDERFVHKPTPTASIPDVRFR